MSDYDTIDKAMLGLSGALTMLGVVVLGVVEILAGQPYGAAPMTNDAGEIVATPAVDPTLRTGLVIAGLLVLFAWGVYRMLTTDGAGASETRRTTAPTTD
ncbi:hypothetical protein [Salinirubrum litoreum]|uniref:Cox cluster protein n=1 Tax=Salinirubrum litoreum TaxID=1126234 RepID=A0ABD5REX2_9EURY|nr:hypothetical protein [Salinirubrum litoreum]